MPDLLTLAARVEAAAEGSRDHADDEFDDDEYDPGDECGRWDNGTLGKYCQLAGTEFCDWECPYS